MNDLLQAAKAVIAEWDYYGNVYWEKIKTLRDAVERAEEQEAVGFEDWWRTADHIDGEITADRVWIAAQQAERERIKDLFRQSSDWFEDDQMAQAKWLMGRIDVSE